MVKNNVCKLIINLWKVELNINAINVNKKTALHKAAYNNKIEIIQLLLVNGADPRLHDENGWKPLDLCESPVAIGVLSAWDVETTKELLIKKESQKKDEEFKILNSIFTSNEFKKKVNRYAFLKAKDGDFLAIKKLINHGKFSIEVKDDNGSTVLAIAVWNQHHELARSLIETFVADVNTQDYKGWTPIIITSYQNDIKMAKLLCECGADPSK